MKGDDIARRLSNFAVGVIDVLRAIPEDLATKHIGRQLLRSATSPGAHYEEARGAESRADFVHKIRIAAKEMRESRYWLGLIEDAKLADIASVPGLRREAFELAAILTASANTARRNS